MSMRCSFTLDDDLMDMIDQYAKERMIDRNKAILELMESGFQAQEKGDVNIQKRRSFEEIQIIRTEIEAMKNILDELKSEVRLMSHVLDSDWKKEAHGVPFQTRKWWMFWK